jgi:hypothetical protein
MTVSFAPAGALNARNAATNIDAAARSATQGD